jgi:hypothetical protein
LIGRAANLTVATEMYKYLVETMHRISPYGRRGKSAISWHAGCAARLVIRLDTQRRESEAASRSAPTDRGNGYSLILTDVYSSEEDLNYDFKWGYPAGHTAARRRAREARWAAEAAERATRPATPAKPLTAAQERAQAEQNARYWRKQERARARADAKVDWDAYAKGNEAGRTIGLDKQVKGSQGKISG